MVTIKWENTGNQHSSFFQNFSNLPDSNFLAQVILILKSFEMEQIPNVVVW